MKLSEYIKGSLGTFSPNPDEWTLEQRLGLEWGKQAFTLEQTNADLLNVVKDCVNFLADLNTTSLSPEMLKRGASLHKRAYTAHSKAKEK